MSRKAKGSGFKMRSGNKTAFKMMGASPVKTDATLVAAAQDLGDSTIPKDNKEIVEKQYEGLIEYNKAKTQMTKDIAKGAIKGMEKFGKGEGAIHNLKNKVKEYKAHKSAEKSLMETTGMDKKEARAAMQEQGVDKFSWFKPAPGTKSTKSNVDLSMLDGTEKKKKKKKKTNKKDDSQQTSTSTTQGPKKEKTLEEQIKADQEFIKKSGDKTTESMKKQFPDTYGTSSDSSEEKEEEKPTTVMSEKHGWSDWELVDGKMTRRKKNPHL